jgi:hypothetical protein
MRLSRSCANYETYNRRRDQVHASERTPKQKCRQPKNDRMSEGNDDYEGDELYSAIDGEVCGSGCESSEQQGRGRAGISVNPHHDSPPRELRSEYRAHRGKAIRGPPILHDRLPRVIFDRRAWSPLTAAYA